MALKERTRLPSVSHWAGRARLPDGSMKMAYEAIAPVECLLCGRSLAVGEVFVRGSGSRPLCDVCQPFVLGPPTPYVAVPTAKSMAASNPAQGARRYRLEA